MSRQPCTQNLVYAKQCKRDNIENTFEILTLNGDNLVLKIYFRLSLCLSFANKDSRINELKSVHTLHCTQYNKYQTDHRSVDQTLAKRGDLCEKIFLD